MRSEGWVRLWQAMAGVLLLGLVSGGAPMSAAGAEDCPGMTCGGRCGADAKDCRNAAKLRAQADLLACARDPGLECALVKNENTLECVGLCEPDLSECRTQGKTRLLACRARLRECVDGAKVRQKERIAGCAAASTTCRAACGSTTTPPGTIARVSVDSSGAEASGGSAYPAISADGRYVAFNSRASNLVAGDANGRTDVFVHDRETGATTRVSVDSTGAEGNGHSFSPALSGDGRLVAFVSRASNLVLGDTNNTPDIFVHDRETGVTTRVSVDSLGGASNHHSYAPAVSGDGRFVAFMSWASNLVPGDTNAVLDVFVHDRETGLTRRASVDSSGAEGNGESLSVGLGLSADGRIVTFLSEATNLVRGDTNGTMDVFAHDQVTGATVRVSVDSTGREDRGCAMGGAISADGSFVVFQRDDDRCFEPPDFNDVFVHDRETGTTVPIVRSPDTGRNNFSASISGDGRWVAFVGDPTGFVTRSDVFLYDRQAGATIGVSVNSAGVRGNGTSVSPVLSFDGRFIAFESDASNLVPDDTNGTTDIFVVDRGPQ